MALRLHGAHIPVGGRVRRPPRLDILAPLRARALERGAARCAGRLEGQVAEEAVADLPLRAAAPARTGHPPLHWLDKHCIGRKSIRLIWYAPVCCATAAEVLLLPWPSSRNADALSKQY